MRNNSAIPAIISTSGCERNCFLKSVLISASDDERVTIIPVETDIRRAGTCDISPSPTVAIPYTFKASIASIPSITIPITRPPRKFMAVTTIDIIESPFTNFDAPSIVP